MYIVYKLLVYISYFSLSVPISVGVFRWKELKPVYRFFIGFLFVELLLRLAMIEHGSRGIHNLYIANFLFILNTLSLFIVFNQEGFGIKDRNKVVVLAAIVVIFMLLDYLFIEGIYIRNVYSRLLSRASLIFVSCICLLKMLNDELTHSVTKQPFFWFSASVLIYCAGTFFLNLFSILIRQSNQLGQNVYIVESVLLIFMYILFTISFLCQQTNKAT